MRRRPLYGYRPAWARRMKDQGLILETFKYSSTLIVTPEKIYNLSDENDEQMTEFKTFMSRQEYKLIKKRLYRGLMTTVHEGGYVSNPPFGYRKVYANRTPTLEIDENQAQYVRMIFDMYVNQGAGSHLIAEHLNSLGITGRRCGYFSRSTVRGILKNPTYTGKVVWNRVIRKKSPSGVVTAHHQPEENWIISQGLHPRSSTKKPSAARRRSAPATISRPTIPAQSKARSRAS